MTERPILFSGPRVVDLREGRKTQTRRTRGLDAINVEPDAWKLVGTIGWAEPSGYGADSIGDLVNGIKR